MDAIMETLDLLANPSAMKALQDYEAGKTRFRPLSALNGNTELSEQVVRFVARRAQEPRRRLREALRELARERREIRPLEGPVENYHRLRVSGYRIVFAYKITAKRCAIQCIFAERRSVVYETFQQLLRKHLLEGERK